MGKRGVNSRTITIGVALVAAIAAVIAVAAWADGRNNVDNPAPAEPTVAIADPVFSPVTASNGRPQPVVALFGDSYSEGAGATNPKTEGYVPLLEQQLGWNIQVTVLSGGGYVRAGRDKTGPVAKKITDTPLSETPDAIVIQSGLNDQGLPSAEVTVGVQQAIDAARAVAPDATVIVVGLLYGDEAMPDFVSRTTTNIAQVAAANPDVIYVDTFDLNYPQIGDKIHPTTEGHKTIADWIVESLKSQGAVS